MTGFKGWTSACTGWLAGSLACWLAVCHPAGAAHDTFFRSAHPVWPADRESEMNLFAGFRAAFEAPTEGRVRLAATGATFYRVYLNGEFLGYGPARTAHGHFRVDEWDLTDRLRTGTNLVAFEVAGYNINSYAYLDQPSFLLAEIVADGRVLASTAGEGEPFRALILPERRQKVQRYTFQRGFVEAYRLWPGHDAWRHRVEAAFEEAPVARQPPVHLLPRRIPHPRFDLLPVRHWIERGATEPVAQPEPWRSANLTYIGPTLLGYKEHELEIILTEDVQTVAVATRQPLGQPAQPGDSFHLRAGEFVTADLGVNYTGFIGARLTAHQPARILFLFDELLTEGNVNFRRLDCVNVISYELQPGVYEVETIEPYTLKYLKILALEGECTVEHVRLRDFSYPDVWEAHFAASDERLNRIFAAARETFRPNAVDVFMDCPSRERGAWLCDSFYAGRVARDLCGDTRLERDFFENYLLPERFLHIPDGMLPMCYPCDHHLAQYIPNWALWFVTQLEEYLARSGDRELVDALRSRVLRMFQYFDRFRNADGLLENLEGWVFIEWSRANDLTQDVNFPSNMLYAQAREAAGRLYDLPDYIADARRLRETIRRQSFDGRFFVDNAVRRDGRLESTTNRTEVCQYYAFYYGVATPATHPELWRTLVEDFGPQRRQTKSWPEIAPANMLPGFNLRLDLLSQHGYTREFLDDTVALMLPMADLTGTLWENDHTEGSLNHLFAAHIAHLLYRAALGLAEVDTVNRRVRVRFTDTPLDWCEGRIPTPDGFISLRWRKTAEGIRHHLEAPAGYRVITEHAPSPASPPAPSPVTDDYLRVER